MDGRTKLLIIFALVPLFLLMGIQESSEYGSGKKPDARVCGDRLCSEIPGGRVAWEAEDETLNKNMEKPEISTISSPRKQMANGVVAQEVICKSGFTLMIRSSGYAACVTPTTAEKLIERGWTKILDDVSEKNTNPRDIEVMARAQIQITDDNPPTNLVLPYGIPDLDLEHGASHPLGVFRFAQDKQPHPGIDLQLFDGAKILAMGDGTIVMIKDGTTFPGDMAVLLQIDETFWGVNYEHFIPNEELFVGQKLSRGDIIGTFSGGYTKIPASIHIDLRYYPDGFSGYSAAFVCWIDNLESNDKAKLQSLWDKAKVTDEFIQGWSSLVMEGNYVFKGLLDSEIYDGPQMCYPLGTDVREATSKQ